MTKSYYNSKFHVKNYLICPVSLAERLFKLNSAGDYFITLCKSSVYYFPFDKLLTNFLIDDF